MTTNIEWTRNPDGSKGETWPVVTGCSHAGSPGCDKCYAARMAATRLKHHPRYKGLATIENGRARWTGEIRFNRDVLDQPLHWKKPRRIFIASMGDLFHPSVPDDFICDVLYTVYQAPQHKFQMLTKRPRRMLDWFNRPEARQSKWHKPLPNLWLGVSVENQAAADERRGYLEQCPAAVKFVSYEPALGPVDWTGWEFVSQIISGGESGPGARPSHPDWHRVTRDFCQENEIAYFMKQWGAWMPVDCGDDLPETYYANVRHSMGWPPMARVGKKAAGHLLDGRTWQEFPQPSSADVIEEPQCS